MRELEKKQKLKRRLYSWPSLCALLIVTIFLAKGAYVLVQKERESAREAGLLSEKVASLTAREQELTAELGKLQTRAGIEEEIKSKYNVAEAGEHVAVIVDRPGAKASTTPENISWWKRIWNAIIGK